MILVFPLITLVHATRWTLGLERFVWLPMTHINQPLALEYNLDTVQRLSFISVICVHHKLLNNSWH